MTHKAQFDFIQLLKNTFPSYFSNSNILEVGSLNINGSIRQFFDNCNYIGIDVGEGSGVDVVCNGEEYQGDDKFFDMTVSCECFEHNPQWVETFRNMVRMTKPLGLVVMTCATVGRAEHGTAKTSPSDSPLTIGLGWNYYKNLVENDFYEHFDFDSIFEVYRFEHNISAHDLYFYGVLKG
jgi:hypothetical protein